VTPAPPELVARLRAAGCVFAEDEAALLVAEAGGDAGRLEALVVRRVAGEPLEHVVGWAEFGGLRVAVGPGVFVPRRRTELLARTAARRARAGDLVVDLCCGCGAVGLLVASLVPGVELHAADVDPVAVGCARRNLAPVGGTVHQGDLDAALPDRLRGRVAVLVANTPYVPTAELRHLPAEAREHEPATALDGGADGLDLARRVVAAAPRWLAPGGQVLVETGRAQAPVLAAAVGRAGLAAAVLTDDALGGTAVSGTA
jgi:release factor glutamine methyltransferase